MWGDGGEAGRWEQGRGWMTEVGGGGQREGSRREE